MTTTKKPSKLDWAIASILLIPTLAGWIWWIVQPTPETKSECHRRVATEITTRKKALGQETIKDGEEIEAIASEIKLRCR